MATDGLLDATGSGPGLSQAGTAGDADAASVVRPAEEQLLVAPGIPHPLPGAEDAARLAAAFGCELRPICGGYRVKTTEHCHVELILEIYNWRVCDVEILPEGVPDEFAGYRRGWRYPTKEFQVALIKACLWSGTQGTEPSGWIQAVDTPWVRAELEATHGAGYTRRHSEPFEGITQEV